MTRRVDAQQLQLEVERQSKLAAQTQPPEQTKPASPTRRHPPANELLDTPGALLNRSHLRELGLERRAVDAVFRALPIVALPGYSRPLIRAEQYLELVEHHTFRGDRVRPIRSHGG
jgi:hypothetical protein